MPQAQAQQVNAQIQQLNAENALQQRLLAYIQQQLNL